MTWVPSERPEREGDVVIYLSGLQQLVPLRRCRPGFRLQVHYLYTSSLSIIGPDNILDGVSSADLVPVRRVLDRFQES